jgi:hypothetical protein
MRGIFEPVNEGAVSRATTMFKRVRGGDVNHIANALDSLIVLSDGERRLIVPRPRSFKVRATMMAAPVFIPDIGNPRWHYL